LSQCLFLSLLLSFCSTLSDLFLSLQN
jgi:hypothetical protein